MDRAMFLAQVGVAIFGALCCGLAGGVFIALMSGYFIRAEQRRIIELLRLEIEKHRRYAEEMNNFGSDRYLYEYDIEHSLRSITDLTWLIEVIEGREEQV